MIYKTSIAICFCVISFACFSQTKPDFVDKYEYEILSQAYSWSNSPLLSSKPLPVLDQFKADLKSKGAEGWEVDQIEQFNLVEKVEEGFGGSKTGTSTLSVIVIFKRKIYDTQYALEKKVEFYTKKYADSIRIEMQTLINSNTWTALGKNYKQEIVDDMLKGIAVMFNETVKKIIDNSKR